MNRFDFSRAASPSAALARWGTRQPDDNMGDRSAPRFLAGGTNLIDLWREGVMQPTHLVDVSRLPFTGIERDADGTIHLGALATNAVTAQHELVREHLPVLRSAILAGASPQIRNRATNGGNLMQRARCLYFYDVAVPCNKRQPGSGCPASTGLARQHAILGASPMCVATHPSDMCVALAALDARIHVIGEGGPRVLPFEDLHRLPGDRPDLDTTLLPGELITRIEIPSNRFQSHSSYLKVRERASYAFALVSVAAALEIGADGRVTTARVALGGVAHKPWRNRHAEAALVGQPLVRESYEHCAALVLAEAQWCGAALPGSPPGNRFKIPLAHRAIVRALEMAASGVPTNTGEDGCSPDEHTLDSGSAGDRR